MVMGHECSAAGQDRPRQFFLFFFFYAENLTISGQLNKSVIFNQNQSYP